jgi:dienelactone hydrolase
MAKPRDLVKAALCAGLAAACAAPAPGAPERRALADRLAAERGWRAETLPAGSFDLVAYVPREWAPSGALTVYIEGDGHAFASPSRPSSDPTPRDPLALRLALAQPQGNAAYLARPCQYVGAVERRCAQRYWTEQRFAPEVIEASDRALDALKARAGASRLTLVGYSGGGAVAALLAARRSDVGRLITVAGNLDPQAWTAHHRVSPLAGSLSPLDSLEALARVPQLHFAGGRDDVVPPALVEGYAQRFAPAQRPRVELEPGFDHRCCWVERWPELLARGLGPPPL